MVAQQAMEENHDEIAAIFEAELRDLDIHDPNEDEYEASLAQIDALGAQLRETLNRSEENDDDEVISIDSDGDDTSSIVD